MAGPGHGWTDPVVTPERGLRVVEGLPTGFHEPRASHPGLLATVAGPALLGAVARVRRREPPAAVTL